MSTMISQVFVKLQVWEIVSQVEVFIVVQVLVKLQVWVLSKTKSSLLNFITI